jgi:hypothetical protein
MPDWYFQIKGKKAPEDREGSGMYGGDSNWTFPPLFSDMVTAPDRKCAIEIIEEVYGKKFPTRVLKKDLDANEFLLSIKEIKEDDHYTRSLFEVQTCNGCGGKFKMIEKYLINSTGGGHEYCTYDCKQKHTEIERYRNPYENKEDNGIHNPVIYKITNKLTGMPYIGKTKQAFTFRWYQHFFQSAKSGVAKFHEAIRTSKVSDWTFEVIEIIVFPEEVRSSDEINKYILSRESFFIRKLNSVTNGYNSVDSVAPEEIELVDPSQTKIEFEN